MQHRLIFIDLIKWSRQRRIVHDVVQHLRDVRIAHCQFARVRDLADVGHEIRMARLAD